MKAIEAIDGSTEKVEPLELKFGRQLPESAHELDSLRGLRRQLDPHGVVRHMELSQMRNMLTFRGSSPGTSASANGQPNGATTADGQEGGDATAEAGAGSALLETDRQRNHPLIGELE